MGKRITHVKQVKEKKTIRFCSVCGKNTTFVYNWRIMHSECKECGSRFASKVKSNKIDINSLFGKLNLRIEKLNLQVSGMRKRKENYKPVLARIREIKRICNMIKKE